MSKSDDIKILFSLLDTKPEGAYQDIVADEQLSESKNRWPIFDLSGEETEDLERGCETMSDTGLYAEKDVSTSSPSTQEVASMPTSSSPFLQQGAAAPLTQSNETVSKSEPQLETKQDQGVDLLDSVDATKETKDIEAKQISLQKTSLEAVFSRLSKKNKIEKTSIFNKLIKK